MIEVVESPQRVQRRIQSSKVNILGISSSFPPHRVRQEEARAFAAKFFSGFVPDLERHLWIFDRAGVKSRNFCVPVHWWEKPHGLGESNRIFVEWATQLGAEAARKALVRADVSMDKVKHLLFISTTGLATPSIDARIAQQIGLSPSVQRTPIWGLGCAGGVAGLNRAFSMARSCLDEVVLVVCVELCGLTFQGNDRSKKNLVASALFGDGACAFVVGAEEGESKKSHAEILATGAHLWPDTLRMMGWDIVDSGFQVVFSSKIPMMVSTNIRQAVTAFLESTEYRLSDIGAFLFHPGGPKVLSAYQEGLALNEGDFEISRRVLSERGNVSSVTALIVLEEALASGILPREGLGLMSVLGPGFSSEMCLLKFS